MRPSFQSRERTVLQDARKPLSVQGRPNEFAQRVTASWEGDVLRTSTSAAGAGQKTGSPVFERRVAISPFLVEGPR